MSYLTPFIRNTRRCRPTDLAIVIGRLCSSIEYHRPVVTIMHDESVGWRMHCHVTWHSANMVVTVRLYTNGGRSAIVCFHCRARHKCMLMLSACSFISVHLSPLQYALLAEPEMIDVRPQAFSSPISTNSAIVKIIDETSSFDVVGTKWAGQISQERFHLGLLNFTHTSRPTFSTNVLTITSPATSGQKLSRRHYRKCLLWRREGEFIGNGLTRMTKFYILILDNMAHKFAGCGIIRCFRSAVKCNWILHKSAWNEKQFQST